MGLTQVQFAERIGGVFSDCQSLGKGKNATLTHGVKADGTGTTANGTTRSGFVRTVFM
jgi:hypothetical protein